ncbi:hypothetical protein PCLA_11f0232 [Pseudomonas citronellolis]|nr:hypothetical protein PCLA_11f0232 [Pseudomonas citronellolis]
MKRKGMPRAPSHAPAIRIGVPAPGRCRLSERNQGNSSEFSSTNAATSLIQV